MADASCMLWFRRSTPGRGVPFGAQLARLDLGQGAGHLLVEPADSLYREIRALRIYEGASEVQKIIIARDVLRAAA